MADGERKSAMDLLTWLHLSDAHIGMREQRRLWTRSAQKLKEDLRYVLEKTGGADVVIFSGDMTQNGSRDQFNAFNDEISTILEWIQQCSGARPQLIALPGNHDLARPASILPESMAFKQFWTLPELREEMWNDAGKHYRDFLKDCFREYSDWLATAISSGLHVTPTSTGLLPGDCSYIVETKGGRAGVVTLNSTWLQLGEGDYQGKLHVDSLQLMELVGNRPDEELQENDANILVTHHPTNWLHASSQSEWHRDINPPGRFDLHMFGHMHEHQAIHTAFGGGQGRHTVQACSMFGLEWEGDTVSRSQGYSAATISIGMGRTLESWPRKLVAISGGDVKFAPDMTQDLDENSSSFRLTLQDRPNTSASGPSVQGGSTIVASQASRRFKVDLPFDMARIRRPALAERGHLHVRRIEQDAVLAALKSRRIAWLSSEWGLGEEAFAACIERKLIGSGSMYTIDLADFKSKSVFLDKIQQNFGVSFQSIAEAVAEAGPSLVLLSGIDLDRNDDETRIRQAEVEEVAQAFSDFAPEACFLLVTRNLPRSSPFGRTELRPLDEADLAVYLKEVDAGAGEPVSAAFISRVMRHTDGIPGRIDLALRELEVGSIDDLMPSNPDLAPSATALVAAPAALISTVTELKSSETRQERRSYNLLLALSGLPHGEQISRLKRFFGPDPIMTAHAIELLNRSLIKTKTVSSENAASSSNDKVLVVPKVVRDYVRESMSAAESRSLDRKSLELYFGESWAIGEISTSLAARRIGEALCDGYEVQNMSALVLRAVSRAIESQESFDLGGAVRLALSFIKLLSNGNHYRDSSSACEDMLSILSGVEADPTDVNTLRKLYAEALRMTGRTEDAVKAFEEVDRSLLRKAERQRTELNMALCYERLSRTDEAQKLATSLIKISPKSSSANHARALLAGLLDDSSERVTALRDVLAVARKNKQFTIAANVILDLAEEVEDTREARELLRDAMGIAGQLGIYSVARLIVQLASLPRATEWLLPDERALLIEAYYYLYNERQLSLFERCHAALWQIFERDGDNANLLKLFRHSSFIWRLSGREDSELKYLQKLASAASTFVVLEDNSADRNKAYLVVRIAVVLGEAGRQMSE